jgi:ABC-2 type transport system ATP-binding protein
VSALAGQAEQIAVPEARPTEAPPGPVVVAVSDLVRRFGEVTAVNGISFEVGESEIFGFLGPNGAGKSTTINMLCTLLRPTAGSARVAGIDVVADPRGVRRHIGLVFQDTTLDDYLTAEENLRFHADLYGVPGELVDERLEAVLEMVDLADRRSHLVGTFSGGMKRRLEIARGLIHSPRVLFLDEPTVGLDPQTRARIWEYVLELRRVEATTIFMTTHSMEEAERCDRIAIIDDGVLVAIDTPDALKQTIGKDRIEILVDDPAATIAELADRFGIRAQVSEGAVAFHVAGGEQFVPTLFSEFDLPIHSIRVARPTLDDVFMAYTGRTIRDAEATAGERLRTHARRFRGRAR